MLPKRYLMAPFACRAHNGASSSTSSPEGESAGKADQPAKEPSSHADKRTRHNQNEEKQRRHINLPSCFNYIT
ncbi:hypothetical protein [Cupriavidus sp. D39]|uniref:hypothetical protein n=1 Tax=Cupriavidus sp. D39 TaxID=2997877 RepID=UPI002270F4E3|nr:hypothetical protein [Cupriavidus sp. D39]MCY0853037.1 hypothetical protein [Cupriavidus sp. D39]